MSSTRSHRTVTELRSDRRGFTLASVHPSVNAARRAGEEARNMCPEERNNCQPYFVGGA